jgi:hypothetical protein
MKYQKGSFITVPTSSILGIGVGPQALYMWLCKHANNDGDCFPSRSTLANAMGCSERSVDGYLEELIQLGLVVKEPRYINNKQTSNNYYLPLGGAKSARGVANPATLASQNLRTELNPVLTQYNNSSVTDVTQVYEFREDGRERKPKVDTTYIAVLKLFPAFVPSWVKNKTYIDAAKTLLEDQTLEDITNAVQYAKKISKQDYAPQIITPIDLLTKWPKLEAHFKKYA